jgi:TolB-like protein/DNA-binding winged helix-turn-helix (wHTH) protein/Tfp pilus assembly protein PilF
MPAPIPTEPAPRTTWRAGDLTIDPGQQRVTRGDETLALPPLSFDVLLALVMAAPDFLSNDALMTRVWGNQVVSLETVTQRIKLLRDALGDDTRSPKYIEGLRGRGYRCIAPVRREDLPPQQSAASAPGGNRLRRTVVVPALAALALGGGLLAWSHWRGTTQPAASDATQERARTVAVLPFDNRSSDATDAYLATAVPEMILDRLSGASGLAVIARGSSFSLAASAHSDVKLLGERLNAGHLVEGSVERSGERVDVAVRLVDTARGVQVWSAHYERPLADIGRLEDAIAVDVARSLATRLDLGATPAQARADRSDNLEAYLAYLRGHALLGRYSVAETLAAVPQFERAIALDPGFGAAHAALYDAHMQAASLRREDLRAPRERHAPLIDRAVAIDPGSGTVQFALAMWGGRSPAERDAAFRRGVELAPSDGRGLTAYAEFLRNTGRSQEARQMVQQALRIDPVSPRAHFASAMFSLQESGVAELEARMLHVLELDPTFVPAVQRYSKYRWEHHGDVATAIRLLEQAIAADPGNPWLRHTVVAMYLDVGEVAAARDVAAGTPQSAASSRLLLALYAGDWKAAGTAAFDAAGWSYNAFENWEAGEALRDYALRGGEIDRCAAFLARKFSLEPDPVAKLSLENFRQAVYLSQLLAAQGRQDEALRLRRAVAAWNDANQSKFGAVFARRVRAGLLLLDNRKDEALVELAGAFQSLDYPHWWYTLERDPVWMPLHGNPRFQAIVAEVHRHVDAQRVQLEQFRRDGSVPRRPAGASGP